jgi:hypothetical protein
MIHRLRTVLALVPFLALAAGAGAQTTVVDEGTFRLYLRGSPVGTETFSIRRTGDAANATTVAQGRVVLDTGEQTRALLQARGPALRPTGYKIEVTGPETQSITGQAAGNRFRATIISTAGEQMREYLASDGAVVLDDGVAHHYYFLALRGAGQVPIILPRQSRQIAARVVDAGTETLTIAGQDVEARRLRVEPDGLAPRLVWVDSQNRVLRLRIPDESYAAERLALP